MRIAASAALAAACLATAHAASPERTAEIAAWLPEKPAATCPPATDRAAWEKCLDAKARASALRHAEKALARPVPQCPDDLYLDCVRTGNRKRYEKPYMERVNSLLALLLAECLEFRGRFTAKTAEYIETICSERSWTMPAHDLSLSNFNGTNLTIDLGSAHRATAVAYALALLGDRLPEKLRAKAMSELDRRVFSVYLAKADNPASTDNWWWHGGANWNTVCHSSVVRAALAVIEDRAVRARFIAEEEEAAPYYIAGFAEDGWCTEGMGYWNYGFGAHLLGGLAIRAATSGKVDLFASPKTAKVIEAGFTMQLAPETPPNFSDGGATKPSGAVQALARQVLPKLTSPEIERCPMLQGGLYPFAQRAFGQEPPAGKYPAYELPVRSWFSDVQVLLSRPRGGRLSLGAKGGMNREPHNHNDLGSYVVHLDGAAFTGDPGGEVYTRRTFSKDRYVSKVLNSYGHPVPVVNGKLQEMGREYKAKTVSTSFSDGRDELALNISQGYADKRLSRLVRTFALDRVSDTVTITDEAEFSEPSVFETPVITRLAAEILDDKTISISDGKGSRLLASISADAQFELVKETIEDPGHDDVVRIAARFARPSLRFKATTTFSCVR